MPEIRVLSPSVVNKIAAGEVIERPASVVKELLENSVDAGAKRIDIAVEKGGLDLVRIADDGCGIPPEQLPLAVASHDTSKIREAEDLFRVGTLGFRGEALASIAEVSRFTLRSRTPEAAAGALLQVVGGRMEEIVPCGCPIGTTIEIEQLFFNTPVRRKFLRTAQTEMGHVTETFSRVALAHPHLHFTLRHGNRELFDLPPVERWSERIAALHGRPLADKLMWVESVVDGVRIAGYAAHPSETRSHNKMQYLFLNGRAIRDRALGHALGEAYRGLILTGRFPVVYLRLDMSPDLVDVNVHPTKSEVRFQDGGRLYSQLLSALRSKFLSTDLTHGGVTESAADTSAGKFEDASAEAHRARQAREDLVAWVEQQMQGGPHRLAEENNPFDAAPGSRAESTGVGGQTPAADAARPTDPFQLSAPLAPARQPALPWSSSERRPDPFDLIAGTRTGAGEESPATTLLPLHRLPEAFQAPTGGEIFSAEEYADELSRQTAFALNPPGPSPYPTSSQSNRDEPAHRSERFGSAEQSRLNEPSSPNERLEQAEPSSQAEPSGPRGPSSRANPAWGEPTTGGAAGGAKRAALSNALQVYNRYLVAEADEGLVIIDQHALHERVLYEQIRARVLAGGLESQRLLVPDLVDLTAPETAAALENAGLFAQLGLTVESFGDTTVMIRSLPAMLRRCQPGDLLRELLDKLLARGQSPDRRDVLDEMLHMMSCKAAIKAGDPLAPDEIDALLELRRLAPDAHHCPHGRPTSLVFTREDLDRQFKRT